MRDGAAARENRIFFRLISSSRFATGVFRPPENSHYRQMVAGGQKKILQNEISVYGGRCMIENLESSPWTERFKGIQPGGRKRIAHRFIGGCPPIYWWV